MKSPFTGEQMTQVYEQRTWNFRGEEYSYTQALWYCAQSGEYFTTNETDDAAYTQVTNQYRAKYGIPFTDEIIQIRKQYGISAAKMAKLLGFGTNQWRLYETGEVPSVSNGRTIRSISSPAGFLNIIKSARNTIDEKDYIKLTQRVNTLIETQESQLIQQYKTERIFKHGRCLENGFGTVSLTKIKNILLFILNECGETFQTKMNKLLFYADFLSYRQHGISITGLTYRALDYGPVPENWDRIYSQFDEITQEPRIIGEREGIILKAMEQSPNQTTDQSDFAPTETEIQILKTVCNKFRDISSSEISRISHSEPAWIECSPSHTCIPFQYAFTLRAL